jgi:fucose permease
LLSLVPFILFSILSFPKPKYAQGFPIRQAANVAKNPLLWLCGFLLFFQSGNEFTVGGWISTHLNESFGLSAVTASFALAGYWAAIMMGRLFSIKIVKFVKNETLILISGVVSLCAALVIVVAPTGFLASLGAVLIGLGFAAIFPTTLAIVGEIFPAFTGTAFSLIFVIALTGGMISPWLTGKIAQMYTIKQGLFIPVVNCSMIIILQIFIIKIMKRD